MSDDGWNGMDYSDNPVLIVLRRWFGLRCLAGLCDRTYGLGRDYDTAICLDCNRRREVTRNAR